MGKKETHESAACNAAKTLASKDASKEEKSAAGSTLAQTKHPERVTSEHAASEAGKVLHNPGSSKEAKSAAGSALAQREKEN